MAKDYYKILGVDKGANAEEIKKAFRKMAHQHHPDKKGGDEAKFKELNEAFQVVGDETKRKQYDQFGADFEQQGGFGGGAGWEDFMHAARNGQGGGQFTVGASASIFGLLGALVYYGRRGGSSMVGSQAFSYALMLGVFGFIMPGVDNYAHAGGFGGGWLAALLLDPLKPERVDHIAIALVCLAASILSIVWSVIHGMRFLT